MMQLRTFFLSYISYVHNDTNKGEAINANGGSIQKERKKKRENYYVSRI